MTKSKLKELVLGEELQRENVAAVMEDMAGLGRTRKFAINAGALRYVDTAGLQLLTALCNTKPEASWSDVSEVLVEQANLVGLTTALRLDDVEPVAPAAVESPEAVVEEDDLCPVF